jgi:hypothetical protein
MLYISPMEKDFEWAKKIIDSVTSYTQIECCENLITQFKTKHWSDDFDAINEEGFNFFVEQLNQHLNKKIKKYSLINEI